MKSTESFKNLKIENNVIIKSDWVIIVQLLADGNDVAEIADKLFKNKRTLETNILNIKNTLDCKTLSHLVALFFRNKLIF